MNKRNKRKRRNKRKNKRNNNNPKNKPQTKMDIKYIAAIGGFLLLIISIVAVVGGLKNLKLTHLHSRLQMTTVLTTRPIQSVLVAVVTMQA